MREACLTVITAATENQHKLERIMLEYFLVWVSKM